MGKTVDILIRFLLVSVLLVTTTTLRADDGDILDRKISISVLTATKYRYLRIISLETGYQFVYDSDVINNDQEINITPGTYTLREIILLIAGNKMLSIKVIGNHIALSLDPRNTEKAVKPPTVKRVPDYTVITGRVFDLFSKEIIPSAAVSINNSGIGTVSNQDGIFRLAFPDSLKDNAIRISHVGYENREFNISEVTGDYIDLPLEPEVIPLQEVVIRVINPIQTIQKMLDQRLNNYATDPVSMTVFYREGIEHKKRNLDLTESVLKVYKTGFRNENTREQVKLIKMRRVVDRQERDTVITKVKAGIHSALMLDLVKHVPDYLDVSAVNAFRYTHVDMSVIDDRLVYVISFKQDEMNRDPLFRGLLYIDTENSALVEAHVEINPEYVEKATPLFVEKSSRNIRLTLKKAAYTLSYRPSTDGVYYLNHVRGDLEFRVKRKRKWFSSNLKVWLEMVTCMVSTENVEPIPRQERISPRSVFSETDFTYDPGFWGSMNIIVPEDELKEFIINNLKQ